MKKIIYILIGVLLMSLTGAICYAYGAGYFNAPMGSVEPKAMVRYNDVNTEIVIPMKVVWHNETDPIYSHSIHYYKVGEKIAIKAPNEIAVFGKKAIFRYWREEATGLKIYNQTLTVTITKGNQIWWAHYEVRT